MSDIASELAKLHKLAGAEFITQLKLITAHSEFHPLEDEKDIYVVGGEQSDDYVNLLTAARKAVSHGFQVYILPNPHEIRTADFIFVRRGIYLMYDLKTVTGRNSVDNRLRESVGQSNRVLLNITTDYSPSALARSIKLYFERNRNGLEVLVFKGKKYISVSRYLAESPGYYKILMKKYRK